MHLSFRRFYPKPLTRGGLTIRLHRRTLERRPIVREQDREGLGEEQDRRLSPQEFLEDRQGRHQRGTTHEWTIMLRFGKCF